MKTYKQFDKSEKSFDEFLKPLDRIDWELCEYILCGWVPSNFNDGTWGQNGECCFGKDGINYYSTVLMLDDKYYFMGNCPSLTPEVYPDKQLDYDY